MSLEIRLPGPNAGLHRYRLSGATPPAPAEGAIRSRVAFAAAHVVVDPLADGDSRDRPSLDWETTLAFRRHLWSLGLGVAEAMDTAQRGTGLDWEVSKELIRHSVSEAQSVGGLLVSGAGTDHLDPTEAITLNEVIAAYEQQVEHVEGLGGRVVLMASRALAALAADRDDYLTVYSRILSQTSRPVIIHWLGPMFDQALAGYWGEDDLDEAIGVVASLISEHDAKVDGVKVSLLDADLERQLRALLPEGVRCYTGDDLNYPELILGGRAGHSDALLGIFDPIAPVAAAALRALDNGDKAAYSRLLEPTLPLARHVFEPPTYAYKTGVVFLAYINGHQNHFRMVGGQEGARSLIHLARLFELADQAGVLADPELAVERMGLILTLGGVE